MKAAHFLFLMFVAATIPHAADSGQSPFPGLKVIQLPSCAGTVEVYYDPAISRVINKKVGDGMEESTVVLETKIDRASQEKYALSFTDGLSCDPSFSFSLVGSDQIVGGAGGLTLYLPGNGSVYVSGHANTCYNQKDKYSLVKGKLVEAKQPYHHVGLESKALAGFAIYSDKSMKQAVANVAKGSGLTVVLNEGEYYLIRTSFGLLGWIRHECPLQGSEAMLIEGLFFAGD